jgi:catechol 2,3-dioxygenase-like lactoylglutathione lyase family enzyme
MTQHLAAISLLVPDYDSAIAYFTGVLGFDLISDTVLDAAAGKRWVQVAPPGAQTRILLAKAATAEQTARIGDQSGGRVFFFLETDDFWRDYRLYQERGVAFTEAPRREAYGTVAVFTDCLGNKWDLVAFSKPSG